MKLARETSGTSANLAALATAKLAYYSPATFSSSFFRPTPTDRVVVDETSTTLPSFFCLRILTGERSRGGLADAIVRNGIARIVSRRSERLVAHTRNRCRPGHPSARHALERSNLTAAAKARRMQPRAREKERNPSFNADTEVR